MPIKKQKILCKSTTIIKCLGKFVKVATNESHSIYVIGKICLNYRLSQARQTKTNK